MINKTSRDSKRGTRLTQEEIEDLRAHGERANIEIDLILARIDAEEAAAKKAVTKPLVAEATP